MGRISGTTSPFVQPTTIHQDDAGVTTTFSYEGTDIPAINALALGNIFPYDITQSFGKSRFENHLPFDYINSTPQTDVLGLWEFFDQNVEKDFLTADMPIGSQGTTITSFGATIKTVGQINALDANLVRQAQQLYSQGVIVKAPAVPLDGTSWFEVPTNATNSALTYPSGTAVAPATNVYGCFTIYLLLLRGQTSFPVFAPVLRFTQTVTSQYAIRASLLNARRIISSETMPILENIPNGLLFNLPTDHNPPVQFIQQQGDLVYGWFKKFPSVRQIARLKWNIVQEWQYGLWPVAIYGELL